jgi:hypothetical protein
MRVFNKVSKMNVQSGSRVCMSVCLSVCLTACFRINLVLDATPEVLYRNEFQLISVKHNHNLHDFQNRNLSIFSKTVYRAKKTYML